MICYRIEEGIWGHDCWGCSEFGGWNVYGKTVYTTKEKAEQAMKNIPRNYGKEYRISEIEID
jgi:hypothetical protein